MLHRRVLDDLRVQDVRREIVDVKKKLMVGQNLGDPMMDGRSMVLMTMDAKMDAKMDDHVMVALVYRYWIDRC